MPLTLPGALQAALGLELTTLCTLWKITRRDGVEYFYTDHDDDILYEGNTYLRGVGYNREAVEDKADMSVDELNIQGVIVLNNITREDIRGQRFDGAEVTLTLVNYNSLSLGGIIRRRGWLGELKQNSKGEFDVELRGLSQALAESLSEPYTPGCTADLGDDKCQIPLDGAERRSGFKVYQGEYFTVPDVSALVFQANNEATFVSESNFDPAPYDYAMVGDTFLAEGEGGNELYVTAYKNFRNNFTVLDVTDLRTFEISIGDSPIDVDPTFFDGGLIVFDTGENNFIAREVATYTDNSAQDGTVQLYLKMPYTIAVGDTGRLYPACDKSVGTCAGRFNNILNFQGYPHVPGDKYLKDYPDAK